MENTELLTQNTETPDDAARADTETPGSETVSTELTDDAAGADMETPGTETVSTELTNGADAEAGEQPEDGETSAGISPDELEAAVNNALTEYFETGAIQVVDSGDLQGINKPLDDLSLTEVCLVIIVLILLGRSILNIIGGRSWSR